LTSKSAPPPWTRPSGWVGRGAAGSALPAPAGLLLELAPRELAAHLDDLETQPAHRVRDTVLRGDFPTVELGRVAKPRTITRSLLCSSPEPSSSASNRNRGRWACPSSHDDQRDARCETGGDDEGRLSAAAQFAPQAGEEHAPRARKGA